MNPGRHLRVVPNAAPSPEADHAASVWTPPSDEQLYERYAPYVGALASRMLGRAAEVEDVVQEVFASAVRGLPRRDSEPEVRGWLAKVTVRRCVRQLRFRRLWAVVDLAAAPSYEALPAKGASPEERTLIVQVYHALDGLPAALRVAWTLHHVEGESLPRAAELCNCSLATVKRRIAAAHEQLTRALATPNRSSPRGRA